MSLVNTKISISVILPVMKKGKEKYNKNIMRPLGTLVVNNPPMFTYICIHVKIGKDRYVCIHIIFLEQYPHHKNNACILSQLYATALLCFFLKTL
jgi:hypothetical protein